MSSHRFQRWLAVGAMLVLPMMAYAQEATLSGTVSDTTGGALPGVTVRALHEASGNSFEGVTDERGDYRLAVRIGAYRVTAGLSGFAPVTRTVTLLVGQQAVVNLQMGVSGVQESVTVTGEAPLLDVTQSSLGGNIDSRQMEELPVNGRNWIDLVMLAPGARSNSINDAPISLGGTSVRGDFQLNIDGQQLSQGFSTAARDGQPRFSRDAIAEFEFISNRFDATQGRSSGVQVNAITKSGTNRPSGSFSGYFRDDRFNAADFVAKRVLPYKDQQLSGTFGGPIRKDRLHFFANYEYERNPQTFIFSTPFAHFNKNDLQAVNTDKKGGLKVDGQLSAQTRFAVRGTLWRAKIPHDITSTIAAGNTAAVPSQTLDSIRNSQQVITSLTQVLSNRALNEIRGGYAYFEVSQNSIVKGGLPNRPLVDLPGILAGAPGRPISFESQDVYSIRDDFTYSFTKGGRHTVKLGGEYLYTKLKDTRCILCEGELDATGGPLPVSIETIFPDPLDASTWNIAPLSSVAKVWRGVVGPYDTVIPRHSTGFWLQDDWTVSPRLTLNLGLRYDLELNAFANDVEFLPFRPGGQPNDINNLGPRAGFSFGPNDRTVIRGGFGLYFGTIVTPVNLVYSSQTLSFVIPNDGRPDFATNPFNGPPPTYESVLARICTPEQLPGCIRRETASGGRPSGVNDAMPYSYQPSIGFQRQLGSTSAFEADYVYVGTRRNWTFSNTNLPNINLTYNPATGANYPFSDISRRVWPWFGVVNLATLGQRFNSHSLQTAFTKRMSQGWQASGTYTLSWLYDAYEPYSGTEPVPFKTVPDLGGEHSLSVGDQRHRAVFNAIWQLRYGFQLSGLYFFGSGERYATSWGTDLRQLGINSGERRFRPDGTIVPRNNLVGDPVHRMDLRFQRRFPLRGRAAIDGMVEVFNVFNHTNYGSYITNEVSPNYGQPQQNANVAYAPRTLQLGFRFVF